MFGLFVRRQQQQKATQRTTCTLVMRYNVIWSMSHILRFYLGNAPLYKRDI